MDGSLTGKHVVVTGATGGLGHAVVRALLDEGASCHVPCYESALADGSSLAPRDRVHPSMSVNLMDEAATSEFFAALPPLWGSVHLTGGFAMAPIVETPHAALEAMWRINCVTAFLCCREAARAMRITGDGGRIVNVTARPVLEPVGGMVAYSMAKAGVASLTQTLADELRADRILVNAIVPSIIDTPANRAAMPDADFAVWPKAADLAAAIAYLVSPVNRVTSGALVPVYGGA